MNDKIIRWVVVLGLTAVIGILGFQGYWVLSNYYSKRDAVQEKIRIVLYKVAERMADYNKGTLPREGLISQRTSNYFIVNINDHIDADLLEFYMLDEMKRTGLELDFEYSIYDCEQDVMVYGEYCDIDDLPAAPGESGLQKYDEFEYYFGVRFTQMQRAIAGDMSLTLILSGLLLITLLFFGSALYIILHQKRLSELQRDFINNMTHELKTPLSSIKIAGDTFLKSPVILSDPRLKKYAQIVSEQSGRLNDHVEKILDVARLEGDLVKLSPETFDLVTLLRAITNEYVTSGRLEPLQIQYLPALDEHTVKADILHVANVMHNLIDNAIKYGGRPPVIEIHHLEHHNSTSIRVQDNGPGIDKKNLVKIFDKFFRVPTGDVHDTKGFGLGLYYVNQIIRLHKWQIDVSSQVGEGSAFTINIPNQKNS